MKATKGTVVTVQYTLSKKGGEVLETTVGDEPFEYLHGYGEIVPGLEKVLEGAEVGFKTNVAIPAADAYGDRDEEAVIEVPRDELPEDIEEGEEIYGDDEEGEPQSFTVMKVTKESVTLDGNHPFAGMDLVFDVEVLGLRQASAEEIEHGHVHVEGEEEDCEE